MECPRCKGTGELPQFHHVQNGVCFRCKGSGTNISGSKRMLSSRARHMLAGMVRVASQGGVALAESRTPQVRELSQAGLIVLQGNQMGLTPRGIRSYQKARAAGLVSLEGVKKNELRH